MEELICGKNGSFLDYKLSWNTTDPYLTFCFEESVISLFPILWLLLFSFIDFIKLRNSKQEIKFKKSTLSRIVLIKTFLNLILTVIYFSYFLTILLSRSSYDILSLFQAILHIGAYGFTLTVTIINFLHLIPSCGTHFIFWTLDLLANIVLFRAALNKYNEESIEEFKKGVYLLRFIVFPVVFLRLIAEFFHDKTFVKTSNNSWPNKRVNFINKLLYSWFFTIVWTGYKRPLVLKDLSDLNNEDKSVVQYEKFSKNLKNNNREIVKALFLTFGSTFFCAAFLKIISISLVLINPILIKILLENVHSENEEMWKGIFIATLIALSSSVSSIIYVNSQERVFHVAMRIKIALSNVILRKSILIASKKDSSIGQLVNLLSVDIEKISEFISVLNYTLCGPFQIVVGFILLYQTLGPSVYASLFFLSFLVPLEFFLILFSKRFQYMQMKLKDQRIKLTSEVLSGIKVIKLYAWEKPFQDKIEKIREAELNYLKRILILNTISVYLCLSAPIILAVVTFGTYILSDEGNSLTAEKAFVALILFNIIKYPLDKVPETLSFLAQAAISIRRVNKFLKTREIENKFSKPGNDGDESYEKDIISFKDANLSWTDENCLRNISFSVKKGELVAIVGKIGSGKSSLISSLLGDLKLESGSLSINGTISYVSQQAWIQNATIEENILFSAPFDEAQYNKTLLACCLVQDILNFLSGDKTEIGENGINLSGGQKQRVALARGVYKNSSIYLLDDPLSAVDSQVAKYIFENVIGPNGVLKNSTRLLVTHNLNFLSQVDRIIVMKNGRISEIGTLFELISKRNEFSTLLKEKNIVVSDAPGEINQEEKIDIEEKGSISSSTSNLSNVLLTSGKLIEDEKTFTGSIRLKIYKKYLMSGGRVLMAVAIFFAALSNGLYAGNNIWLSHWSSEKDLRNESRTVQQISNLNFKYLGVYSLIGCLQTFSTLIFLILFAFFSLRTSKVLHSSSLKRVLKSPMSYFDTTLTGRLMNRFAKDLNIIDTLIPPNTTDLINNVFEAVFSIVVIAQVERSFILMSVPIYLLYLWIQRFYVSTSRQLKRLEAQSRSPIYAYFNEIISGSTIIRAFKKENEFIKEFEKRIDTNQKCYFAFYISDMWISIRLRLLGSILVFFTCLFSVILKSKISAGAAGLAITYSVHMTRFLNDLTKQVSNLESNIVSVERVSELTETPQELDWESDKAKKPKISWPPCGEVIFQNYSCQYRTGTEMILKKIDFTINPGEKIGIVGRTGAGKSSMTLALFRLIEPSFGKILIDGIDITSIGLHDLRKRITIIPQDPVLFSGSIRCNLDPFDEYTDEKLWKCLEAAHLKKFFASMPNTINFEINKGGDNLSTGQKQLVCLARALLRKTKILVLDEATASVDPETESLLLKTIRKEFRDSTVITIAHRISNILNSDRVIVLDAGKIIEFDTPDKLLQNSSSLFYKMTEDANL